MLNNEEHVSKVAFFTTLAGYVHWKLTGRKVLGVGRRLRHVPDRPDHPHLGGRIHPPVQRTARGGRPAVEARGPAARAARGPAPRPANSTEEGAKLLDPTGTLQAGITLAPPEGDAGTGMMATNSVRKRTGNVSAGTSIFATVCA